MEEKNKTHIRLMSSDVGMESTLIYLDLDLKIKSLISSLKIVTTIAINVMRRFNASILVSFRMRCPPYPKKNQKKILAQKD